MIHCQSDVFVSHGVIAQVYCTKLRFSARKHLSVTLVFKNA